MKKAVFLSLISGAILVLASASAIVRAQDPDPGAPSPQEQSSAAAAAPTDDSLKKGIELNKAKQYSQAETALQAAVAAQPGNAEAHFQLGVALFEQGKVADAAKQLDLAAPIKEAAEKQLAEYYRYRGAVYAKQQKWNEAVGDLEKAIQLDPMEPYNHYYIGVAYGKLKKPDKMVEQLQMFLKLAPNAPEAQQVKALLRGL